MSTKHTPGPWEAITVDPVAPVDPSRYAIVCAADPIGTRANDIAMVWLRGGEAKAAANARLIAAAPSLLMICEQLIACHDDPTCPALDLARAIVKSARGEA